ncbi:C2H2-type zinc finger transcription factor [Mucor lusitanicus]|uniref:C2H2-type zinc finger transcription factor n=2 Tax=Mucor circinelloides f. lusitanicus TaxID=29924 RepID=A0A168MFA9_MUCCL|nr:C2H2-type zinc finger transcription factor [Mucor lusitanicus]OAD04847.1 C2H2-type zinc finger transcription factor [Mucor lusitanicus CBS 277.49]
MQLRNGRLLSNAPGQPRQLKSEHDNDRSLAMQIKLEATEKPSFSFRRAPVAPNPFLNRDYYYFCKVCNIEMPNLIAILKHRKKLHPDLAAYKKPFKFPKREPNIHHPKHYCRPCAHTFKEKCKFRAHLRDRHHIVIKGPRVVRQNDILPDWNDPEFYCTPCGRGYKSKYKFWVHCRAIHGMERPEKIALKVQLPDLHDPNLYCRVCDVTFKSHRKYRAHCHRQHKMNYQVPDPDSKVVSDTYCKLCDKMLCIPKSFHIHLFIQHGVENEAAYLERLKLRPDINDPNLYCCRCDMTLPTKQQFEIHMLTDHSLHKKPLPTVQGPAPSADDPNNHCSVCNRTYKSKSKYRWHIRKAHNTTVQRTFLYDPNHFPDPLDPSGYCSVCKNQYPDRARYRAHCRYAHRMVFPRIARINIHPNASIDIHHPDFYCAKCDHYYGERKAFRTHIKNYHSLMPKSKEEFTEQTITENLPAENV